MLIIEIEQRLELAESLVRDGAFDENQITLDDVVESLSEGGLSSDLLAPAILLRLASLLRNLGLVLNKREKDGDALFNQAQSVLDAASTLYPDDAKLLNEQGTLFFDVEEYDKAFAVYDRVLNLSQPADDADRVYALVKAGTALRELRKFSGADLMFKEAVALGGPPSTRLIIERGRLRFYQEQYELAFREFTAACAMDPPNVLTETKEEAMAGQIASLQAEDSLKPETNRDRAMELALEWQAREGGPTDDEIVSILKASESIHTALNLYPAAALCHDLLMHFAPNDVTVHFLKIAGLKWLRRFKEAEELYRSAQAMFPDSVELWKEMGNVYYRQKRYQEAYMYYSGGALSWHANREQNNEIFKQKLLADDEAAEWVIVSLRKMRDLKGAWKKIVEVLSERENSASYLSEKAVLDFTERKYDSAIDWFDRALDSNDYYDFAQQWRAAAYRKKLDFDTAKSKLELALEMLPAASGLWEERAWLAFDQGNFELAGEYFDKAIELDPYLIDRRFSRIAV